MRLNGRQIGVLLAALLPVIAAAGCTGSDLLTPGSGNFETRIEFDNIGGRFVDDPFDRALVSFRQMEVRPWPSGSQADEGVGPLNLGLLRTPFRANFVSAQPSSQLIPLTSGSYVLVHININDATFSDVNDLTVAGLSDPVNPTCHDFIKSYNPIGSQTSIDIFASDLGAEVVRSLDADTPGSLTMRVDFGSLVDALNASTDCASCSCPGFYTPNDIPRFCSLNSQSCSVDADCPSGQTCEDCKCPVGTSNFDVEMFIDLASTFLNFE
jgi:hypothetical protein